MQEKYLELLANTVLLLSKKMKKDYASEEFIDILKEDIGFDDEDIEEIIEVIDSI